MTHQPVTALSGLAWCLDCAWEVEGLSDRSTLLLAAAHANAPEGHSMDGCEPVMPDCCDVPRWRCQTFTDAEGIVTCVPERGCRA